MKTIPVELVPEAPLGGWPPVCGPIKVRPITFRKRGAAPKTYVVTATPIARHSCDEFQQARLKRERVTVEMTCGSMGTINRNKIDGLVWDACQQVADRLGIPLGGMMASSPKLKA